MQISGFPPSFQVGLMASLSQSGQRVTTSNTSKGKTDLNEAEQKQLRQLQDRDREVRAHEAAHKAVAGPYATSGASFSYQKGPDGRLYAIGGEVGIDTSPVSNDPEATLQKANQIRAAALAPAQPSGQDQSVAAEAAQMAAQARSEIIAKQRDTLTREVNGENSPNHSNNANTSLYQAIERAIHSVKATTIDLSA